MIVHTCMPILNSHTLDQELPSWTADNQSLGSVAITAAVRIKGILNWAAFVMARAAAVVWETAAADVQQ